ncbi:MAG: acyltransferase family protein [Roseburia sp.]
MNKERDYFFDNLKAVLIFLVVLGHFLLPIRGDNPLVVVKRLIYVFHMPLFVFISGYFAKKIYKNGQYNFVINIVSAESICCVRCGNSDSICHCGI